MDFLAWNNSLCTHFFNSENADSRIRLFVTKDLIQEIGRNRGSSFDDFILKVKNGPPWITRHRQAICAQALQAYDGWRNRPEISVPPYLAYLALFVLAVDYGDNFSQNAYYPRLRSLIGDEPFFSRSSFPSFEKMLTLWDDLESWATVEKQGQFGEFRSDFMGEHIHVGVPYSQVVLSEPERSFLPDLFARPIQKL